MKKVHKEIVSMLLLLCMVLLCIILFFYYKKQTRENMEGEMTNEKIKYYVITLGSDDRKQNIGFQQQRMKTQIEIVNGVVGKNLTEVDLNSMKDPVIIFNHDNIDVDTRENNIKKNEIGCYLSHYQLYKKIAEDTENQYTVIFEDDFTINNDFELELNRAMKEIKDHPFDIIYLYLHGHTDTDKKTNNICVISEETGLFGTGGYLVNNKNIKKLIDATKVMTGQIDSQLQDLIRSKKIQAYKFCPYISNVYGLPSTIQNH